MRAATHARTWLLALACLVVFASCRRVTIISFHASSPAAIDALVVNLHGTDMKRSVQLDGMDEQLGLYNLSGDKITISAFGCVRSTNPQGTYVTFISVLDGTLGQNDYSIVSDAVTVEMAGFTSDPPVPCPTLENDGSVSGDPSGAGGAAGAGNGGGDAGTGGHGIGGAAGAGAGGMTLNGDAGRDGGVDAAGGAGGVDAGLDTAGAGGNTGVGGCDDAGHGSVDATICNQPPDPVQNLNSVTPSLACIGYCNRIIGAPDGGTPLCQGSYESVEQCQQYCTKAAWEMGTANDMYDTMNCRTTALTTAEQVRALAPALATECGLAGPSGGTARMACGLSAPGGICATFCNAWAKICPGRDASACISACQSAPGAAEPACRFPWLLRATGDDRYCDLVDYAGMCVPPGC